MPSSKEVEITSYTNRDIFSLFVVHIAFRIMFPNAPIFLIRLALDNDDFRKSKSQPNSFSTSISIPPNETAEITLTYEYQLERKRGKGITGL